MAFKISISIHFVVPRKGLEPSHLAVLAPKASVSTNFTTWAYFGMVGGIVLSAFEKVYTNHAGQVIISQNYN